MTRPISSVCAVIVFVLAGISTGCTSRDASTANIAPASAAKTPSAGLAAGDNLGLSLHQSDVVWAEIETASAPTD